MTPKEAYESRKAERIKRREARETLEQDTIGEDLIDALDRIATAFESVDALDRIATAFERIANAMER